MEQNKTLTKYHKRLKRKAFMTSMLLGLERSWVVVIIMEIINLIGVAINIWLAVAIAAMVFIVTTLLLYNLKLKPTERDAAKKLDELGLEERTLTMVQLQNDNSFIAQRQREDANNALNKVSNSRPQYTRKNRARIVSTIIMLVSLTLSLVVIGSGIYSSPAPPIGADPSTYTIDYKVMDNMGGRIDGPVSQLINSGANGDLVQAIADDGYVFVGWSDGVTEASRQDTKVTSDLEVFAIFVVTENDDERGDEDSTKRGEGNGDNTDPSDLPPSDGDAELDNPDANGDGEGGTSNPNNQVLDGETYYGNEYGGSLEGAQNDMSKSDYSDSQEGIIGDYFNNIAK